MKIMHVTKKYPGALGGDAVVVSSLQKQQQSAGHKVVIVTSNCADIKSSSSVYKCGLADTPARLDTITPRRIISLVMLAVQMVGILRREQPNVVHTHSVDMAFCVSLAVRFNKIPLVHTFHIVTFYDQNQSWLRRKTELWLARKSKLRGVTAPNEYDVSKLLAAGISQTRLLPNGVDLNFWGMNASNHINQEFTFVAIGRLERQKGYEYLIRAAALLAAHQPAPFRVVVIGEGSQHDALAQLIDELQVGQSVVLAGRKSTEAVRALLVQADAAVFCSLYETTPLTLLEAWAAGTPAIATPVGILRDASLDFDAACVVPLQDEQALASAMQHTMTDRQFCQNLAVNGQREAQKYAWPTIARAAESMYRSVQ